VKKHTVLFLEWSTKGREFEMDFPLMYFFEKYLGWNVEYKSQFNLPSITKNVPDLIIMSGTTGAKLGLEWSRIIEKSNIPLFTQVTEGMFRDQDVEEFVWGWGKKEKHFSEMLSMLWSYRSYKLAINNYPETEAIYKVSGAIGFDKYTLFNPVKPKINYGDPDKKIIGYAGFDFNNILDNKNNLINNFGVEKFDLLMDKAFKINRILENIIQHNRDILFLLKPHPGDGGREPLEFKGLLAFDNVQIVGNDTSILDVISISDIWLSYNSSTNLEAWLLKKPSISFNKDEDTFSSDVLYGSILEDDAEIIDQYIKEYYEIGYINEFDKKKELRSKLISDYIGFHDGFNHVRFMSFLRPYIENIEADEVEKGDWNMTVVELIKGYIKHIIYSVSNGRYWLPYFKKWASFYERFNESDIVHYKTMHYPDMERFYNVNADKINELYSSFSE